MAYATRYKSENRFATDAGRLVRRSLKIRPDERTRARVASRREPVRAEQNGSYI